MTPNGKHLYRFSEFLVDRAEQRLSKGEQSLPITPKAFELLGVLLEQNGRLVERDELMARLWPNTVVEEANLAQTVSLLRKVLGDTASSPRFIETVPTRGYRFVGQLEEPVVVIEDSVRTEVTIQETPRRWRPVAGVAALLLLIAGAYGVWRGLESKAGEPAAKSTAIRSLAVVPFRPLAGGEDEHLGVGMASSIIVRFARAGGVTVRPLSAVRKYQQHTDALQAGREQKVDAVLSGTMQRVGSTLRVTAMLLRTADGASLWAEEMDVRAGDMLQIQDTVADRAASRLGLVLKNDRRDTGNAEAREYFLKGARLFDRRGDGLAAKASLEHAILLFRKAIEIDPAFARAHGTLAFAYAWMLLIVDPDCPDCLGLARHHADRAIELDPTTPEVHLARYELLWSVHSGFQIEEAIRALRLATRLDPTVGHYDLGTLYAHVGLEEPAVREFKKALEIDPLSEQSQSRFIEGYRLLGRLDEAVSLQKKLLNRGDLLGDLVAQGDVSGARRALEESVKSNPTAPYPQGKYALLLAMEGRFSEAEARIPDIMRLARNRNYHHATYDVARVYAMQGKAAHSLEWLRKTADTGMPNYILFSRDRKLDPIREAAGFQAFMATMKSRWEALGREFQ
ncbi:MAG: hypothetical protein FJW20_23650 [Acidimicrobiia bacterium]|nr:hypothetical protein [Acidimicrobiia bacterium]